MDLHEKLLNTLQEIFGERSSSTSRFGSTSLGEIADQLCLSNSLLTKLISGTATQGMYERCLKNLERIRKVNILETENERLIAEITTSKSSNSKIKYKIVLLGLVIAFGTYLTTKLLTTNNNTKINLDIEDNFLDKFFNPEFSSPSFLPYVPLDKVQDYCPCSGYEGEWSLSKPYTIPIPFTKPGLFYMAKSSDVKLKCASSNVAEMRGKQMHGFEIMKHELWMDSQHENLVPKYFDPEKKQYTKEFYNIKFEDNTRYDKVAEITSLFYNNIEIRDDKIIRKGEPAGRYASYVNDDAVIKYKIDLNEILNHAVGSMTKVSCEEIQNPYCNPNSLVEGESILDFGCKFSIATENLGYGGTYPYVKGFKLVKQHYSNNLLCNCEN